MKALVKEVNAVNLEESKTNLKIETKLNPSEVIQKIKEREEMPNAYLIFLTDLGELDGVESKITLKILRLYIYARSKFRGDAKGIKDWLQSGSLQGDRSGGRFNISILYNKLRAYSKARDQKKKLSDEVDGVIKEITEKNVRQTKNKETSYQKKEFRISDLEDDLRRLLDEILAVLDKTETLISSRNDQW